MSKRIRPPALSTGFSERGESAKKRFENILSTNAKKTGVLMLAAVVCLIAAIGAIVAYRQSMAGYTCGHLSFSVALPSYWQRKYDVDDQENSASFYHTGIREKYGAGTGTLFTISRTEGKLTKKQAEDTPQPAHYLTGWDGFTYVFSTPSDVQYPAWEGGDKALADEYLNMTKDLRKIRKSVKVGPQTRAGGSVKVSGAAILTYDTPLFSDAVGTDNIGVLERNDLVSVIDETDRMYYVQLAAMSFPPIRGYLDKQAVSFDSTLFSEANYGTCKTGIIYRSQNESDLYDKTYPANNVFRIVERHGEWSQVNLPGGDDGKWVKTADISYEFIYTLTAAKEGGI